MTTGSMVWAASLIQPSHKDPWKEETRCHHMGEPEPGSHPSLTLSLSLGSHDPGCHRLLGVSLYLSALGLPAILSVSDSCSSSPRIRESPLLRAAKENDLCVLKKLLLDRTCDFRQRGGIRVCCDGEGTEVPAPNSGTQKGSAKGPWTVSVGNV